MAHVWNKCLCYFPKKNPKKTWTLSTCGLLDMARGCGSCKLHILFAPMHCAFFRNHWCLHRILKWSNDNIQCIFVLKTHIIYRIHVYLIYRLSNRRMSILLTSPTHPFVWFRLSSSFQKRCNLLQFICWGGWCSSYLIFIVC